MINQTIQTQASSKLRFTLLNADDSDDDTINTKKTGEKQGQPKVVRAKKIKPQELQDEGFEVTENVPQRALNKPQGGRGRGGQNQSSGDQHGGRGGGRGRGRGRGQQDRGGKDYEQKRRQTGDKIMDRKYQSKGEGQQSQKQDERYTDKADQRSAFKPKDRNKKQEPKEQKQYQRKDGKENEVQEERKDEGSNDQQVNIVETSQHETQEEEKLPELAPNEEYVENTYFGDFVKTKSNQKQAQAREPEKIQAKVQAFEHKKVLGVNTIPSKNPTRIDTVNKNAHELLGIQMEDSGEFNQGVRGKGVNGRGGHKNREGRGDHNDAKKGDRPRNQEKRFSKKDLKFTEQNFPSLD